MNEYIDFGNLALGYDYGSTTSILTSYDYDNNNFEERARCRSSVIIDSRENNITWPESSNQWQQNNGFIPSPKRFLNNFGQNEVPKVNGIKIDKIIQKFTFERILQTSQLEKQSGIHLTVTVPETYNNTNCRLMSKACIDAFSKYFQPNFNSQGNIDLLPEPIAAALYYTYEHLDELAQQKKPIGIITCDIGGGTTDIAYVRVELKPVQNSQSYKLSFLVLASDGYAKLGGDDITKILINKLVQQYNIPQQETHKGWLWDACEDLKRKLSDAENDNELVFTDLDDNYCQSYWFSYNRTNLENNVNEWKNEDGRTFENCISGCVTKVINDASKMLLEISDNYANIGGKIDAIPAKDFLLLPIGGSMKMPLLRRLFQKALPHSHLVEMKDVSSTFDSVSRGAALYSAYRLNKLPEIDYISIENRTMYYISVLHSEHLLSTVVARNVKTGQYDIILYPNEILDDTHFRLRELRLYQSSKEEQSVNKNTCELGVIDFGRDIEFEVNDASAKGTPITLSIFVDAIYHEVKAKVKIENAHEVGSKGSFCFPPDGEWLPIVTPLRD